MQSQLKVTRGEIHKGYKTLFMFYGLVALVTTEERMNWPINIIVQSCKINYKPQITVFDNQIKVPIIILCDIPGAFLGEFALKRLSLVNK